LYNTANILLKILNKKGVAYFIGNKVRNDIVNPTNKKKKKYDTISIISSLSQEELNHLFKNSIKHTDYIMVNFGLYFFKIYSFRFINDQSLLERQKNKIIIESLNYVREKKDFTINVLLMNENEEIIDYKFTYRNSTISSLNDLNNKIIRIIGNPKEKIKKDPILILKAFRLMSILNYTIEKNTLSAIEKNKHLLQTLDKKMIVKEFNKLIKGKNLTKTLILMKQMDILKLKIENKYNWFYFLMKPQIIKDIVKLNKYDDISLVEIYTVIFRDNYDNIERKLKEMNILDDNDIEKVKWLVKHFNILQEKNKELRLNIYNSRDGIVSKLKMPVLKELLNNLVNIYILLENNIKREDVMFALCSRPYFYEQIKLSDNEILTLFQNKYNMSYNGNLDSLKEKILYSLILLEKYPNNLRETIYNII